MLRQPSRALGATETAIYRRLVQPDAPKLLTTAGAMEIVRTSAGSTSLSHSMSSLESKGGVRRIGKGVYLNRSTGLAPKIADVIPWVFRNTRYYYLGLNSMANHWGLSPQIPYTYQVIYSPKNEAQVKRIASWCSMLEKVDKDLGGTLVPVLSRTGTVDKGVSQSIIDGSQLPASTIERTIVDSIIYTNEIGGASEALLWTSAALSRLREYTELEQLVRKVHAQFNSVAARLGFLLETALSSKRLENKKASVDKLMVRLEELATKTRATYNWGREKTLARYFEKWHLRVSSAYLRQLKEVSSYE